MTFIKAALAILAGADGPMTAHELFDAAVASGLIKSHGRTPFATMLSCLYVEVNSDKPRVEKVSMPGRTRAQRGSVRWTLTDAGHQPTPKGESPGRQR